MAEQGQGDAAVGADLELARQLRGGRRRDLDLVAGIEQVFGLDIGPVGEGDVRELIRAHAVDPTPIMR
ncbi:hypothetical protein D3C80_1756830 [compost metagenome]